MKNIDWFYLKRPIIIFAIASIISATLILAGRQFENALHEEYQRSLTTLRATHALYRNIINDIDLLDQYRNLYNDYKISGLIGQERRLSWVESLETTNEVLRLPTLAYDLKPQEVFQRPGFEIRSGVKVTSSPMELSIGMLHEEDLFALLEGLRLSIKNLFTVDGCTLVRQTQVERSLDTRRANLATTCQLRWVTIDVG